MKISSLVRYLEQLEKFSVRPANLVVHKELAPILNTVESSTLQYPELLEQLAGNYQTIIGDISAFNHTVAEIKNKVRSQIAELEPAYFSNSYRGYNENLRPNEIHDIVLHRRFTITKEVAQLVESRIKQRSDWKYSGMIIRPGLETWVGHMVSLDPLYLLDESHDLLQPVKESFNHEYVARLRLIQIDKNLRENFLSMVPDNQIAFCLVYNFFNYKPMEVVVQYLKEIYSKLKPGGAVAFTINNCDRHSAVELVEHNVASYTPGSLICEQAKAMLFEVEYQTDLNNSVTWIELSKPGMLSSIRGGQALAKVLAR